MHIETERLTITRFTMDMATAVHLQSLDEDNPGSCRTRYLRLWRKLPILSPS